MPASPVPSPAPPADGSTQFYSGTKYDADGEWIKDALLELAGVSDWTAIDLDDEGCFWYDDTSFSFWTSSNYDKDEVKALKGIAIVYYVSSDNATEYAHYDYDADDDTTDYTDDADITYDGTYADNWVSIYSDSDWTYQVDAGTQGEAGYYALAVTTSGAVMAGITDSWSSSWSVTTTKSLSDLTSDGEINMKGGYVTVLGVYYTY